MDNLALGYDYFHPDSTYYFASQEYTLAGKLRNKPSEANALITMSIGLRK